MKPNKKKTFIRSPKFRKKNRFSHCVKRARERYGIDLTYEYWAEILPDAIKTATFSRPANEEEVPLEARQPCVKYYVVDIEGIEVIAVLDTHTDEIQTFLPNKDFFFRRDLEIK